MLARSREQPEGLPAVPWRRRTCRGSRFRSGVWVSLVGISLLSSPAATVHAQPYATPTTRSFFPRRAFEPPAYDAGYWPAICRPRVYSAAVPVRPRGSSPTLGSSQLRPAAEEAASADVQSADETVRRQTFRPVLDNVLPREDDPLADFGGPNFPLLGALWRVTILSASLGWIDPDDPGSARELVRMLEEDLPDSANSEPRIARRIDPREAESSIVPRVHPLRPIRRYLRQHARQADIDDYTCVVMRQERVFGQVRPREFLRLSVRRAPPPAPGSWRPESVHVRYLMPADRRGTEISLAAAGSGAVQVRDSAGEWRAVELASSASYQLPPSRRTVGEITLASLARQLLSQLDTALQVDPLATNTVVRTYAQASVDGRPCRRIRIHHPRWQQGLRFCRTEMYYDVRQHLPLRVERYDWPGPDQTVLPLVERYTYMDLAVNTGRVDEQVPSPNPDR